MLTKRQVLVKALTVIGRPDAAALLPTTQHEDGDMVQVLCLDEPATVPWDPSHELLWGFSWIASVSFAFWDRVYEELEEYGESS